MTRTWFARLLWQMKRELLAFFFSPLAYVLVGTSALINGAVFLFIVAMLRGPNPPAAPTQFLFSTAFFWLNLLVLTPPITMRAIAEERQAGTFDHLITTPLNEVQIVMSKFFSCYLLYVVMWLPVLIFPAMLDIPLDAGPLWAGFIGTLSIGTTMVAAGILASALSKNQLIAAIIAFGMMATLFLVGLLSNIADLSQVGVLRYINIQQHMVDFSRGIVDSRPLIYNLSITGVALFAAIQVLGARRWQR